MSSQRCQSYPKVVGAAARGGVAGEPRQCHSGLAAGPQDAIRAANPDADETALRPSSCCWRKNWAACSLPGTCRAPSRATRHSPVWGLCEDREALNETFRTGRRRRIACCACLGDPGLGRARPEKEAKHEAKRELLDTERRSVSPCSTSITNAADRHAVQGCVIMTSHRLQCAVPAPDRDSMPAATARQLRAIRTTYRTTSAPWAPSLVLGPRAGGQQRQDSAGAAGR